MKHSSRSRPRRWLPSIAPLPLQNCMVRVARLTLCQTSPTMRASPNTSPTGPHAQNCSPRQAQTPKRAKPTKSLSALNATPRSAASCSSANPRYRFDLFPLTLCSSYRLLEDRIDFRIDGDVRGGNAVDAELGAVALGEMEEAANVVVLIVRRKEPHGFGRRELKRRQCHWAAKLVGEREVQ